MCCDQIEMIADALASALTHEYSNKDIQDLSQRLIKMHMHRDRLKENLMFWDNLQFNLYQKMHEEMY